MCRPWPGLRCDDHPQQKVVKLSAQIHKKENEISNIDALMNEIAKDLPADEAQNDSAWQALQAQRAKLLDEVSVAESKRNDELLDYSKTKSGQEALAVVSANEDLSTLERLEAATDLEAGKAIREEEKELSSVLNNPDLSPDAKVLYAKKELEGNAKSIRRIKKRTETIERELASLQIRIDAAKEAGFKEEALALSLEKGKLLSETSHLDKKLKHKQNQRKQINSWMERMYKKGLLTGRKVNNWLIREIFKLF